jgi:hypothetical protein
MLTFVLLVGPDHIPGRQLFMDIPKQPCLFIDQTYTLHTLDISSGGANAVS